MRARVRLAVSAFLLSAIWVVSFTGCKNKAKTFADEPQMIKLGEIQPLTGSEAMYGLANHRGMELAVQLANQSGGIKGKKIQVISMDYQGKPELAATVIQKLIHQDHVIAVVGPSSSSPALAAGPIAQKAQIPLVTPSATNPTVTQVGDAIFRGCFIDSFQGSVMARFARERLGIKKFAVLYDHNSDYSVGLMESFVRAVDQSDGTIVIKQPFDAEDVNFRASLTSIRAKQPEAIFVPSYYTAAGLIIRQARELGIKAVILGTDGFSSPKLVEGAGPYADNVYYSNHFTPEQGSPVVLEFVKKFREKYGSAPDGIAALGFDTTQMVLDALRRAPDLSSQSLKKALSETQNFEGVTGRISLDRNRNPIKSAVIMKVEAGQVKYFTTMDPTPSKE